MKPAFSVIFLTTLIGAGQGLFMALYALEMAARQRMLESPEPRFFVAGAVLAVVLSSLGLLASFFHLGHPERAWRAAAKWRTSWLSREVLALPAFIGGVFVYGVAHAYAWAAAPWMGLLALVACLALFVCTGMVYACLRFLQEWASPLTLVNFFLLGAASGCTLAAALAAWLAPQSLALCAEAAIVLTAAALAGRAASLARNAQLRPKSSLQTAIGIRHTQIVQKAQGFMGGSFNTREFFHGASKAKLHAIKWTFLLLTFPVPVLLLAAGLGSGARGAFALAFAVQYAGLLAERWYFFAQANHPQNLYYQAIS
ncbi:MAG: DmsC/YnfH family molybdoenzyme membrane anchor subunit [Casimicrobiaceae bacterium]